MNWNGLVVFQRRALDGNQSVDRERFGVSRKFGDFVDQTNAILILLSEPKDTARAHGDTSITNGSEGIDSVIVGTSCDDFGVELARSVKVVVVSAQACVLELTSLFRREHAECGAD